ncbi:hypothetical protein SSX86_011552 [Deinandra increscens subsp. villosa]|uniref:Calmodulin-binding protein n=1 Tax=Deinandra increscens subsp. villosa TaxID=3103831 RepID=A0AAP0DB19_9ASTR
MHKANRMREMVQSGDNEGGDNERGSRMTGGVIAVGVFKMVNLSFAGCLMVLKRPLGDGEGRGDAYYDYEALNPKVKQRIVSSNFAGNVIHGLSSQELALTLEPLIRGWVRDEVQRACQSFCCSSPRSPFNALEPCGTTSLQLRFLTKLPQMLFTGSKVESENNDAVKLVLFDTVSNEIVSSGPLSSSKIQIVPFDSDFSVDDDEDWSQKDFEAKLIYARDGKRPLVAGDLQVVLKDGVPDLGEVFFTDNSSWRRSRTFRLGARAISGARIREAISNAFMVKDHRGESYKKHHPPALGDDIWRLEKVAQNGAFHQRLASNGIRTVKHLLQMYYTNELSLRKILSGSSNKTWETIIKHAKDCVLDDMLYMYNCGSEGIGLLFNSVFKIVGGTFDGQNYLSLEELPVFQMTLVESLKHQMYKNLDGMLPMDDLSVFGPPILTSGSLGGLIRSDANLLLQNVNISPLPLDPPQFQLASTSYMDGVDNSSQSEIYMPDDSSLHFFSPALRNSFIFRDFSNGPYGEGSNSGSGMLSGEPGPDFSYQVGSSLWQGNINNVSSEFGICFSRAAQRRWRKLRAVVKFFARATRMTKSSQYLYFSS